ncbi:MAG: 3-oxoacyl-ACP reductase FabG [Legionellaceae bacterium]|nr:3-oxoacyl-ACP reductase FabG [Legionellaceae bacterium]
MSTTKTALVTGASRGIGQAIADVLAKQGMYVIGTATTPAGAEQITHHLQSHGGTGEGVVLDVTQNDQIEELFTRLADCNLTPQIVVNNAGITRDNLLLRMDQEEWDTVLNANLTAAFRICQAAAKTMLRARWGRIINIGSIVGSTGNAGQANYTAAKAGLVAFSKSLAQEIASRNITVNVVSPGFIDTDMTQQLPDAIKETLYKQIPMRRLGAPIDVANVVAFLASDAAAYITGQNIHVNGGMFMP